VLRAFKLKSKKFDFVFCLRFINRVGFLDFYCEKPIWTMIPISHQSSLRIGAHHPQEQYTNKSAATIGAGIGTEKSRDESRVVSAER